MAEVVRKTIDEVEERIQIHNRLQAVLGEQLTNTPLTADEKRCIRGLVELVLAGAWRFSLRQFSLLTGVDPEQAEAALDKIMFGMQVRMRVNTMDGGYSDVSYAPIYGMKVRSDDTVAYYIEPFASDEDLI